MRADNASPPRGRGSRGTLGERPRVGASRSPRLDPASRPPRPRERRRSNRAPRRRPRKGGGGDDDTAVDDDDDGRVAVWAAPGGRHNLPARTTTSEGCAHSARGWRPRRTRSGRCPAAPPPPPPKPSPAKSILKSPPIAPVLAGGGRRVPRRGFLDDDAALFEARNPHPRATRIGRGPAERARRASVGFELAEDRERQEDSRRRWRASEPWTSAFAQGPRDAVAAAQDAERALAAAEAAVATATRNKAARDRVKARAGGGQAAAGAENRRVDEDSERSRDRIRCRRRLRRVGPNPRRGGRPLPRVVRRRWSCPRAPSRQPAPRAGHRGVRPSKNGHPRVRDRLREREHRERLRRRERSVQAEKAAAVRAGCRWRTSRLEAHRPPASRRDHATG